MEVFTLLLSTVLLRPYVFAFLGLYFFAGVSMWGLKRTLAFTFLACVIAFASEYSSTRNGIPFGHYYFTGETYGKELYIFNIPFIVPLSYPFLAYFSYSLALLMLSRVTKNGWRFELSNPLWYSRSVLFLSTVLFVLQDVLIDPVSLRGSRWFLGQIYYYHHEGTYFGVPLSNFLGWFLVGLAIIYCFQKFDQKTAWPRPSAKNILIGPFCYFINMAFILFITFYIGEYLLGLIGTFVFGIILYFFLMKINQMTSTN